MQILWLVITYNNHLVSKKRFLSINTRLSTYRVILSFSEYLELFIVYVRYQAMRWDERENVSSRTVSFRCFVYQKVEYNWLRPGPM